MKFDQNLLDFLEKCYEAMLKVLSGQSDGQRIKGKSCTVYFEFLRLEKDKYDISFQYQYYGHGRIVTKAELFKGENDFVTVAQSEIERSVWRSNFHSESDYKDFLMALRSKIKPISAAFCPIENFELLPTN